MQFIVALMNFSVHTVKYVFTHFFYDEVNSEHNVTFSSHLCTKTVGANQHIYIFPQTWYKFR